MYILYIMRHFCSLRFKPSVLCNPGLPESKHFLNHPELGNDQCACKKFFCFAFAQTNKRSIWSSRSFGHTKTENHRILQNEHKNAQYIALLVYLTATKKRGNRRQIFFECQLSLQLGRCVSSKDNEKSTFLRSQACNWVWICVQWAIFRAIGNQPKFSSAVVGSIDLRESDNKNVRIVFHISLGKLGKQKRISNQTLQRFVLLQKTALTNPGPDLCPKSS